jgi:uncharacterized protein
MTESGPARTPLEPTDRPLAAGRGRLVLVGGLPGTGKTTLAERLGAHYGWPTLHSDRIRAGIAGYPPAPATGSHRPQWTAATYAVLLDEAEERLREGGSVVLDATWTDPAHRSAATRLARHLAADLVELRCTAPEPMVLERLRQRPRPGAQRGDAGIEAYHWLAATAGPWPGAVPIDTSGAPAYGLDRAVEAVDAAADGRAGGGTEGPKVPANW